VRTPGACLSKAVLREEEACAAAEKLRVLMYGKELPAVFPKQDFLLPPSLREWIPDNHVTYFISDLIEREECGYPPYHPRMMTEVLVQGRTARTAGYGKIVVSLLEVTMLTGRSISCDRDAIKDCVKRRRALRSG
jgi:hypothetical protein